MEKITNCPLCQTSLQSSYLMAEVAGWKMVRCRSCSLGMLNPRPDLLEMGKYYKNSFFSFTPEHQLESLGDTVELLRANYTTSFKLNTIKYSLKNFLKYKTFHLCNRQLEGSLRNIDKLFLELLKFFTEPIIFLPYLPNGKILDVGFGRGEFLLIAKRLGWNAHGIDNSSSSIDIGTKIGLNVNYFDGSFETKLNFPDNYFDVVTLQSVLEHIHNPCAALNECFRIIKPGGLIIIVVPNLDCYDRKFFGSNWGLWDQPKHLFHFNTGTLNAFLSKAGFISENILYKTTATITESKSLQNLKRSTNNQLEFLKISFMILYGKRFLLRLGVLKDFEIAQNIAVYGRKPHQVGNELE